MFKVRPKNKKWWWFHKLFKTNLYKTCKVMEYQVNRDHEKNIKLCGDLVWKEVAYGGEPVQADWDWDNLKPIQRGGKND